MKKALLVGSALGSLLVPQIAVGQEAEAEQQAQARSDNAIIVTAQRREESLQDAAIPIVAATGEQLVQAGVNDVTGLNKIAPSLNIVNQAGSATSFFIRGVGNFNNNNLSDPAVAFNFDGVYVARPSATAAFLDVERVEVLKGPQGTLYGRNATGGAINVIPVRPQLGEFGGFVQAGYGNYDAYDISGAINAPLGESAALRISATVNGHDGYFSDGTGDAENFALRGQFYAELGPVVDVRLVGEYATKGGVGPGTNVLGIYELTPNIFLPAGAPTTIPNYTYSDAPANVAEPFTGLYAPQAQAYFQQFGVPPLFTTSDGALYPSIDDEVWGVHAEVNVDLGDATVTVIPAYRSQKLSNVYGTGVFQGALQNETAEQYSIEARIAGEAGPIDYVAGLFYFNEDTTFQSAFNQWAFAAYAEAEASTESWAAFARASFNVTDSFRIVGGIRYTEDIKSIDAQQPTLTAICLVDGFPDCTTLPAIPNGLTIEESIAALDPALFVSGLTPLDVPLGTAVPYIADFTQPAIMIAGLTTVQDENSFDRITWRGAIEYDITPDNLIYASFESGYRSGGFNITFGREAYGPEFLDAYTIGSKNIFFDGLLQLNIEGFIWKYRDQQSSHLGLDLLGVNAFFTENIGRSTLQGFDIDFLIAPTRTTTITGNVQYLDANNDEYVTDVPDLNEADTLGFITPVTGCPFTNSSVDTIFGPTPTYAVDCSGTRPLNAPEWSFNLGLEQVIDLGDFELVANVLGRFRSNRELNATYMPTSGSGEDLTADASLTLRPYDERWFITAYVRNLTDNDVLTNYQIAGNNVVSASYEPPRTYGVRAGIEF